MTTGVYESPEAGNCFTKRKIGCGGCKENRNRDTLSSPLVSSVKHNQADLLRLLGVSNLRLAWINSTNGDNPYGEKIQSSY